MLQLTNNILHAQRDSKNIKDYKNKNDVYKEINEHGYIVFQLSEEIDKQINDYGIENMRNDFNNKNSHSQYLTKMYGDNNKPIICKYSKAIEFFESKNIGEQFNEKMDEIFKSIHNFLINSIENLNENHITNITSSIINSIPIPPDEKDFYITSQNLHIDYKEMSNKDLSENKYPLSVIIALEDNTVLRILPKSHKLFDVSQDQKEVAEVILNLKKGQVFIFHPNLIHSG